MQIDIAHSRNYFQMLSINTEHTLPLRHFYNEEADMRIFDRLLPSFYFLVSALIASNNNEATSVAPIIPCLAICC